MDTDNPYKASDIKVIPPPKSMSKLLETMRTDAAMFCGKRSLRDLKMLLIGFSLGRSWGEDFVDDVDFASFDNFICEHYQLYDTAGWERKISYYCSDEAEALDEFFTLYDQFLQKKDRNTQQPGSVGPTP